MKSVFKIEEIVGVQNYSIQWDFLCWVHTFYFWLQQKYFFFQLGTNTFCSCRPRVSNSRPAGHICPAGRFFCGPLNYRNRIFKIRVVLLHVILSIKLTVLSVLFQIRYRWKYVKYYFISKSCHEIQKQLFIDILTVF